MNRTQSYTDLSKPSRRDVLFLSAGATLALTAPSLALEGAVEYSPKVLKSLQASGKPVLLDFSAKWCGTCRRQARVIEQLVSENPAYRNIQLVRVDWDKHRQSDIRQQLAVPRRSTLIMLKGEQELGRIVAQTSVKAIQALLETGV
ncbi:MAG: thioredoxin family protein [Pseudomonadota bacterium]